MRIRLLLLPFVLLAIGAASAQNERRFMLTNFDRIRLEGPFTVEVVTGMPAGATVTGEARAAERVNLRVDGGILVIAPSTQGWDGWREGADGATVIRVSTRELHAARVNGGGKLTIDRVGGSRLDLSLNGSGQLIAGTVDGDELVASLTGTGSITLSGGSVRRARFLNRGAGSIESATSVGELTVQSQSSGDSRYVARLTAAVTALGRGALRVDGPAVCRLTGPGPMTCAGKAADR